MEGGLISRYAIDEKKMGAIGMLCVLYRVRNVWAVLEP